MDSKQYKTPAHLGIIMDGNGRWAQKRNLPRVEGHLRGVKALRLTAEACIELGIEILTIFAFSTENWGRPIQEVSFLMKLFRKKLEKEVSYLVDNNIRLRLLGDRKQLPEFVQEPLSRALEISKNNDGITVCLAMNYGSRDEIIRACRKIAEDVEAKRLRPEEINESVVSERLFTGDLKDPDLIIRTSGELRLSNFLLWQSAYSELYFTETLWPDFNRDELLKALEDYAGRNRRLGKINETQ